MVKQVKSNRTATIAVVGSIILAVILVLGTVWMGYNAKRDTEEAVRSVSLLYLDELAGRREQVVKKNLQDKIQTIRVAIDLMTEEDLSDKAHLEAYQTRMKQLYHLDKFAFVDTDGLIYTSAGTDNNIADYGFDYKTLSEPDISILNPESKEKTVIIAAPINISFRDKRLSVCFMAINMNEMLSGVSMTTNTGDATFCNLYTLNGTALTNSVLGGLAMEDNLLEAMRKAAFEEPNSYNAFVKGFQSGKQGVVSFTYNDIHETLTYIPVNGTDWQLTYLIRESVISERIGSISDGTVRRSVLQSVLTVAVMLTMFGFIVYQIKRNSRLLLQHETTEAESRVKHKLAKALFMNHSTLNASGYKNAANQFNKWLKDGNNLSHETAMHLAEYAGAKGKTVREFLTENGFDLKKIPANAKLVTGGASADEEITFGNAIKAATGSLYLHTEYKGINIDAKNPKEETIRLWNEGFNLWKGDGLSKFESHSSSGTAVCF